MHQIRRSWMMLGLGFMAATMVPLQAGAQPAMPMMGQPMMHHSPPPPTSTTLTFNVSAEQKKAPDMATMTAGVVTLAKTAKAAMADNAQRMAAAFTALKAAGVADKDIQTTGIQLNPQYEAVAGTRPRIVGYQANNQLTVKLRNLTQVGPVMDALVAQGINEISGPNFGLENPDALLDAARSEAMAAGLRRADLYAKAAGLRIKRIVTIQEEGGVMAPMAMAKFMPRAAFAEISPETPVAPGEVSYSIQLSLQIELEK